MIYALFMIIILSHLKLFNSPLPGENHYREMENLKSNECNNRQEPSQSTL